VSTTNLVVAFAPDKMPQCAGEVTQMSSRNSVNASKIAALGKASKTEAVQIRFDPKRRFALEMVARRLSRPVSNLLEEVTNEWLVRTQPTIVENAENSWSPFVADRFVMQAQAFPDTLTDSEAVLWALIKGDDRLWKGDSQRPRPKATEGTFNFELLRNEWEVLCNRTLDSKQLQDFNEHLHRTLKVRNTNG
jgi:hypothetical protein